MFRRLFCPNCTSLLKCLRFSSLMRSRRYSNGCPCPSPPPCPPPCPPTNVKITICGANGQVGQIIAFLLKQSPLVNILSLYDLDNTYGTAMDLSHIDTSCKVQSFCGCADLYEAMCVSKIKSFLNAI